MMFETPNTAFLPELEFLLEISRAKNCRKHSFSKKHFDHHHLEATCLLQNQMRERLKNIIPREMKPIEDPHYGIDYLYNEITLDQKFSFGGLGENTIKVRVDERRLVNNSDWTMIINKNHELEFFPTKKLALFVKKNWGIVQKRLVGKKESYSEYAVKIDELYIIEKVKPILCELEEHSIKEALHKITQEQEKILVEEAIQFNKTIVYKTKMLCFEPILAKIAAGEQRINP
ncbi:MAG: hypothetical protein WCW44_06575 [archaeon]